MFFVSKLFFILLILNSGSTSKFSIENGRKILRALDALLNFFENDSEDLNLDGLYGIRIAQGQLKFLDEKLSSENNETNRFTDKNRIISKFLKKIDRISSVSLDSIKSREKKYFNNFALITTRPFLIDYRPRSINRNLIEKNAEKISDFDEQQSDQCFTELIGQQNNSNKCFVDKSCWELMTSPHGEDYRLTHQLLWFLVAENLGCLSDKMKNLILLKDKFCSNVYDQAERNFLKNFNQDLFLEQILLCSIIGYEDFIRSDWLNSILSWQDPLHGCFGPDTEANRIRRNLLYEQEMKHNCLSHKSGLAAGVLATFARVFFQ